MAISRIGGTGSDNWELISSVTPTAATAAVNFTGLSPYRKLLVRFTGIVLNANDNVFIRLNNDSSSANYTYMLGASLVYDDNDGAFVLSPGGTNHKGYAIFNNCDTASIKELVIGGGEGSSTRSQMQGRWIRDKLFCIFGLL
jgi:hypothetical protein